MHYYFDRYAGDGSNDAPYEPSGAADVDGWGAIDMRPDSTKPEGPVPAAYPERLPDRPGRTYLGDNPDEPSEANRRNIESQTGVPVGDNRLRRIIPELLISHGDDKNPRRWNRLRPGRRLTEVWLGGKEPFWTQRVVAGGGIFTESFNQPDSTVLGPDLTWTETIGNLTTVSSQVQVAAVNTVSEARAETDLATSDNYAQLELVAMTVSAYVRIAEAMCRHSSTDRTAYMMQRAVAADGTEQHGLRKIISGSITVISGPTVEALSPPTLLRSEAEGSTARGFLGGVQKHSVTDTSITTGTRAGMRLFVANVGAVTDVIVDKFEYGDLGPTLHDGGAALDGASSLSAVLAALIIRSGDVDLAGSGALAVPDARRLVVGGSAFAGAGNLAAAEALLSLSAAGALDGSGDLLATAATLIAVGGVAFTGAGELVFLGDYGSYRMPVGYRSRMHYRGPIVVSGAIMLGDGSIAVDVSNIAVAAAGSMAGTGSIEAAEAALLRSGAGILAGVGALEADPTRVGAAVLTGAGALAVLEARLAQASAVYMTGSGHLVVEVAHGFRSSTKPTVGVKIQGA